MLQLSVIMDECHYDECHYDECQYDEYHYDEYHYDECHWEVWCGATLYFWRNKSKKVPRRGPVICFVLISNFLFVTKMNRS